MESFPPPPTPPTEDDLGFVVFHQKLELSIDFPTRTLCGTASITIIPQRKNLRKLRFNLHQADVSHNGITVQDIPTEFDYEDGYAKINLPERVRWNIQQCEMQKDRINPLLNTKPRLGELEIEVPASVKIKDTDPFNESAPAAIKERFIHGGGARPSSIGPNNEAGATTPISTPRPTDDVNLRYEPLNIVINFTIKSWRDGLQWVGVEAGDQRYPHVYTKHSLQPGLASSIFPCVDDPSMRSTWDISIKCGKTLGDAMRVPPVVESNKNKRHLSINGHAGKAVHGSNNGAGYIDNLTMEDKQLEMTIVCSADLSSENTDLKDNTQTVATFYCANQVAARHIGFAVGPFVPVDLSDMRDSLDDEKLGQKAIQVIGYCLPRRQHDLRNICATLPSAIDWFSLRFGSYPFSDYKLCFVEDLKPDTEAVASLSFCSTRLLLPEDIIDPEVEHTRKLVHTLASQWIGVNVIAGAPADMWAVVGISGFMTDLFMRHLCGNNEYRFRLKTRSDKLVELDIARPSLSSLGELLHLGSFQMEFMALKAPLVLFILDQRLVKASGGSIGLSRVISRFFFNAGTSDQLTDKTVTTNGFRRLVEKVGHFKSDSFFEQYILGAGCPYFQVTQKFNKKRLSVEMTIAQKQDTLPTQRKLEKDDFLREFKEETNGVYAGDIQVFTGPMTIRIHEADGTPYEHIVEIREAVQKIEIPYHTKYKRLKRSRREKERAIAGAGADVTGENENDVLLYCLGDTLQSQDDVKAWGLSDWDPEVEMKMDQESYEWIRMDADFEWLCELTINMPAYMYVSQLQQDRDVVAQQDSMLFLGKQPPHPLASTILVRTLMDRRYFHGIRTMATSYLPIHAIDRLQWIGRRHLEKAFQHFFCHNDSESMPKSNDFSDKKAYIIQCAIPRAMAKIRDESDRCPHEARRFILDQLSFNDNHSNDYSDHFYVANLMKALTDSLLPLKKIQAGEMVFNFDEEDQDERKTFVESACEEIDRYRRMDEWDPSHQNIYTVTALECKQRLMAAKVIPKNPVEFFRYAHDDTLDVVRVKAVEAVVDLGYFTKESFLRYLMKLLSTDPSPFVREKLFAVFGKGLAGVAFGEHSELPVVPHQEVDGLILEEDINMDAKKALVARTMSIEGALAALKDELKNNTVFKDVLWDTITSKQISPWDQGDLLDICALFTEAKESMIVQLKLPRYWKVEKIAKGLLCFKHTNKTREKRMPSKAIPLKISAPVSAAPKSIVVAQAPTPKLLPAGVVPIKIKSISVATLPKSNSVTSALPKMNLKMPTKVEQDPSIASKISKTIIDGSPIVPSEVPKIKSSASSSKPLVSSSSSSFSQSTAPSSIAGQMKPPSNPLKRPTPPDRASSEHRSKIVKLTLTKSHLSHYPRGVSGKKRKPLPSSSPAPLAVVTATKKVLPVPDRTPLTLTHQAMGRSSPAPSSLPPNRRPLPNGGTSSSGSERKSLPTGRVALPSGKSDGVVRTPLTGTLTASVMPTPLPTPGSDPPKKPSLKLKFKIPNSKLSSSSPSKGTPP